MVPCGRATMLFNSVFPNKSDTIKSAPVIGAVVSANLGSRSQHGPGSSAVWADNSCLVGGRAALSGWQHLSEPGTSCQHLTRSSWTPPKNDGLVLHKCGISPHRTHQNTLSSATESSVEIQHSVCLCVIACPCCASWSWSLALPSLSLSISRMISLTWAPQGLVILVISSTRRSIVAASGRPNNAEKRRKKTL